MPIFSSRSMTALSSCERDIQTIMQEVVKYYDCSIIEGHRSAARQHEHWQKGRQLKSENLDPLKRDHWKVVDSDKVVTGKDGYEKKSRHQNQPSDAIDIVPYPTMWANKAKQSELIGVVKYVQDKLLAEGRISKLLDNGADLWNGFDLPHLQIRH